MHHHNKERFEEICVLIGNVDPSGDSIRLANMYKSISEKIHETIKDEKVLSELFDMFNVRALEDDEFILSLVAVITSRQLDSFTINGKVLRHAMLSILQKNFQNADNFKRDNMNKFYNSIKLLGEYFNKARLTNGSAINIIGQSMLNLINVELEKELRNICHLKSDDFARLVLSQIALNGNLLKTRHKTEIEQVLLTIRKCNIELSTLSPKTRAFFHMTLDLYYSNYTAVGETLEKLYKTYLIEDIGVGTVSTPIENGRVPKATENGSVQASLEKMSINKKVDEVRKSSGPPRNLKVQIKKQEPFRTGSAPMSPQKGYRDLSLPRSPQKNYRDLSLPRSPQKSNRDLSLPRNSQQNSQHSRFYSPAPSNRNPPQSPSSRYAPSIEKINPKSPSSKFRPRFSSSPSRNVPQRSASQPPSKKVSPQDLRSKKSPQHADNNSPIKPSRSSSAIRSPKVESAISNEHVTMPDNANQNGTDVLRQQNSRSSTPSSSALPAKYKVNDNKVYFREENVENLTWHGDGSIVGDAECPDGSTSPKVVNPYSSSFLNFLSSN